MSQKGLLSVEIKDAKNELVSKDWFIKPMPFLF